MTDPELKELAAELENNPHLFAYRIVELIVDVREMRDDMKKGKWLALTVLLGVIVDLAMRLAPGTPDQTVHAVASLFT